MSSIRLRKDQIERMKRRKCPAIYIIHTAIRRYDNGEIVIQKDSFHKNDKNILQIFPLVNKPKYSSAKIRAILDAHFASPMFVKELAEASRRVDVMIQEYTKTVQAEG